MSEEENLADFASRALRGPRKRVYQQLLSQKLIRANMNKDPLQKIKFICEAAFMSRNKENVDIETVELSHAVCISLMRTSLNSEENFTHIPWAFPETEENYERFIRPWFSVTIRFYPLKTLYCHDHFPSQPIFGYPNHEKIHNAWKEVKQKILTNMGQMSPSEAFFVQTSAIGKNSFRKLKGEFEKWAMKPLYEIVNVIVDEIDPKVYHETLSLIVERTKVSGVQ